MKAKWTKNVGDYLWSPRQGIWYRITSWKGNRFARGNYRVRLNGKLLKSGIAFLQEAKDFAEEHFAATEAAKGKEGDDDPTESMF
ncbi:MAG: hypothetical protein J2P56_06990 [Verrucomicrobia bacterium]|nr:hypothetical protein [Verrucomicrobiota bacterium]